MVLRGDTNIKYLVDNACHIWDGDAYKNYCNQIPKYSKQFTMSKEEYIEKIKTDDEFAKKWGELGPIYGKQWRKWSADKIHKNDQITNLINELKTNPDSRRLMVSTWNVGELDQMVLPPCHYGFQVYTRKENEQRYISLMWNQRSVDTFLGLPFNIASYGLLLEIIAKEVNMVPDELIGNLGDVHLYKNHIEQAKEQMYRRPYDLPKVQITERNWYQHELVKEHLGEKTFSEKIMSYRPDCFELIGYQSHEKSKRLCPIKSCKLLFYSVKMFLKIFQN
jgi:thymidylate synthase